MAWLFERIRSSPNLQRAWRILQSRVVLYHGSFAALARIGPGFDWREETWETLSHELRHHLEWRANVAVLEAYDWAAEQNFCRNWFPATRSVHEGVYVPLAPIADWLLRCARYITYEESSRAFPTDVDLMAEFDDSREFSLLDRVHLENRLADLLGVKVDLAPARMLKDSIRGRATREAVIAF